MGTLSMRSTNGTGRVSGSAKGALCALTLVGGLLWPASAPAIEGGPVIALALLVYGGFLATVLASLGLGVAAATKCRRSLLVGSVAVGAIPFIGSLPVAWSALRDQFDPPDALTLMMRNESPAGKWIPAAIVVALAGLWIWGWLRVRAPRGAPRQG